MDVCGPVEVFFQAKRDTKSHFHMFSVAERKAPIKTSEQVVVLPDFDFDFDSCP